MEIKDLTEKQRKALMGLLPAKEYADEGMGLFEAGMVTFDPLLEDGDPRAFQLTQKGRTAAHALRTS